MDEEIKLASRVVPFFEEENFWSSIFRALFFSFLKILEHIDKNLWRFEL